MMVVLNLSGCLHVTSAAFAYSAWSKTHMILVNSKDRIMFSDWLSTSLGALMVGRYPTLSGMTVTSSRVRMLTDLLVLACVP